MADAKLYKYVGDRPIILAGKKLSNGDFIESWEETVDVPAPTEESPKKTEKKDWLDVQTDFIAATAKEVKDHAKSS